MNDRRTEDLLNDPAFLRGLTMRRMSRRDLFRSAGIGAGALSLGAILAACGGTSSGGGAGGGSGSSGGGGIDWNAKPNGTMNFANWPLYIDKKKVNGQVTYPSLDQFTNDTSIKVNYREAITANADFFGKIQPQLAAGQSAGWDLMVITNGTTLSQLLRLNYLVELPADKHPNFDKNASAAVTNPAYDPGNKHTMAWQSGLTGIGWDPAQVKQLRPSKPTIDSFQDLLDPAFKGKVGMLTEMRDTVGLAMLSLGSDPTKVDIPGADAALDLIDKAKTDGQVRAFTGNEYLNKIESGDFVACLAWSGDIVQLQKKKPNIKFVIPEEGGMQWFDTMVIPILTTNVDSAAAWMNFVYDPVNAAKITAFVQYIPPCVGVRDQLTKMGGDAAKLADNPILFPDDATKARLKIFADLSTADEIKIQNRFNKITGG